MGFKHDRVPTTFRCSAKQQEVMTLVLKTADSGRFLYMAELNRLISWGPIKSGSLTTIIRHLEMHGFVKRLYATTLETDVTRMIECKHGDLDKVRGMKMHIVPTPFAYEFFRPKRTAYLSEPERV